MSRFLFSKRAPYRIARHVIFFFATVLVFTFILLAQKNNESFFAVFFVVFLNALFFFGYAYITIFVLIQELLLRSRYLRFFVLFLLIGIGLSVIKLLLSDFIFYSSISPENIENAGIVNFRFILVNTKDMSFIVALFCVAKYAKDFLYYDRLKNELIIRNRDAQDKLLQSQFDSHFLFNTINNLYAISLLEPDKTLKVIARLKTLLYFIIDESTKQYINITDEIELLHNYILLEKLRYGDRLKIEFERKGDFSEVKVPPMILFVLVENCFKHGSSLDAGTPWIKINLTYKQGEIFFFTQNSVPKENISKKVKSKKGESLNNLKKRLELLYGENFDLVTIEEGNIYKTQLMIKLKIG